VKKYKNWSFDAANKLAVVIFQICDIHQTLLKNVGIYDYKVGGALLDMFVYSFNSFNSTVDNVIDPDLRDYVVPDLKKVIFKIF
jgi:hypothetical protein